MYAHKILKTLSIFRFQLQEKKCNVPSLQDKRLENPFFGI